MDERVRVETKRKVQDIYLTTIDDVLHLNSLLTFAVFIGLSQTSLGTRSLENRDECNAGPGVSKRLVVYEVFAFACFLASSLSAKSLKLLIRLETYETFTFIQRSFDSKEILLLLTATTSIVGILLLVASIVCLVQIQIGLFSCGSNESRRTIWGVCTLVSAFLVIYVGSMSIGVIATYGINRRLGDEIREAETVPLQQTGVGTGDMV